MAIAIDDTALVRTESPAGVRLGGQLGVGSIVFMVVAAAAPLTVIGGAAPLGILLGNGVGYPSMYAISGVVLLVFSVGLSAMSRAIPRPGAFFTYIGHSLGHRMGLGAASVAMLTYTAIQVAVYAFLGYSISSFVTSLHGPMVPWWGCSLVMLACVGWLGYRHIDLSGKVLAVLLCGEIAIVCLLSAVIIARHGAEGLSMAPFQPHNIVSGAPGVGMMMAIAGYVGFEATAVFRDEARDPDRTIPRATYAAVILIGVFYTFAGWAMVMGVGPSKAVETAAADPGGMVVHLAGAYLGTAGRLVFNVLLLTSLFACVLSFHNVIARYTHSLAHAGALPLVLGHVHESHGSPHRASLSQTATALALLVAFTAIGLDPVLQVFTWFSGVATVGVVLLMGLTSLAVLRFFHRSPAARMSTWQCVTAPLLAFVGLLATLALVVAYFPVLVGSGWGLAGALMVTVPIAYAAGAGQATYLKLRRPTSYRKIAEALAG